MSQNKSLRASPRRPAGAFSDIPGVIGLQSHVIYLSDIISDPVELEHFKVISFIVRRYDFRFYCTAAMVVAIGINVEYT